MGSLSRMYHPDPASEMSANTGRTSSQSIPKSATNGVGMEQEKVSDVTSTNYSNHSAIDAASANGNFGWATIDNVSVPILLRNRDRFVSARIVEMQFLSQYPNTFPAELGVHSPLVSYRITHHEQILLNEININHCSNLYGDELFKERDLIVKLEEFEEFYNLVKKTFPEEVVNSRSLGITLPPPAEIREQPFGWIQINHTLTPYIRLDGKKFVMLPILKHAAGLLKDVDVPVLLPSIEECSTINQMCKDAGLDFQFCKSSKLVDIDLVREHHTVVSLELPLDKPLTHAKDNVSLESLQMNPVSQEFSLNCQQNNKSQQQTHHAHEQHNVPPLPQVQTFQQQSVPQQQTLQQQCVLPQQNLQQHSAPQQQTLEQNSVSQVTCHQSSVPPEQTPQQQSLLQQQTTRQHYLARQQTVKNNSVQPLPQRQPLQYQSVSQKTTPLQKIVAQQHSLLEQSIIHSQRHLMPNTQLTLNIANAVRLNRLSEPASSVILKQKQLIPPGHQQQSVQNQVVWVPVQSLTGVNLPPTKDPQLFSRDTGKQHPVSGPPPNVYLDSNDPRNKSHHFIKQMKSLLPDTYEQLNIRPPPPYKGPRIDKPNHLPGNSRYRVSSYQISKQASDTYTSNASKFLNDTSNMPCTTVPNSSLTNDPNSVTTPTSDSMSTPLSSRIFPLIRLSSDDFRNIAESIPQIPIFPSQSQPITSNSIVTLSNAINPLPTATSCRFALPNETYHGSVVKPALSLNKPLPVITLSEPTVSNEIFVSDIYSPTHELDEGDKAAALDAALARFERDATTKATSMTEAAPPANNTLISIPTTATVSSRIGLVPANPISIATRDITRRAQTATISLVDSIPELLDGGANGNTLLDISKSVSPPGINNAEAPTAIPSTYPDLDASGTDSLVSHTPSSTWMQEITPHVQTADVDLVASNPELTFELSKPESPATLLQNIDMQVSSHSPVIVNGEGQRVAHLLGCIKIMKYRGKCISCLEHEGSIRRKGKYALLEAINKLYFSDFGLNEIQFCMENLLNMPCVVCTPEEEKAFVQYYELHVTALKCNKIVEMNTLDTHFQQLVYIFSKNRRRFASVSATTPSPVNENQSISDESLNSKSQTVTNEYNHRKRKHSFDDTTNTGYEAKSKAAIGKDVHITKSLQTYSSAANNTTVIEID